MSVRVPGIRSWSFVWFCLALVGIAVAMVLLLRKEPRRDRPFGLIRKGDTRDGRLRRALDSAGVKGWPKGMDFLADESRYWEGWTRISSSREVFWYDVTAPLTREPPGMGRRSYLFVFSETGKLLLSTYDDMHPCIDGFGDFDGDGVMERVVYSSVPRGGSHNATCEVYRLTDDGAERLFRVTYSDRFTREPDAEIVVPSIAHGDGTSPPRLTLQRGWGAEGTPLVEFVWDVESGGFVGPEGGRDKLWLVADVRSIRASE